MAKSREQYFWVPVGLWCNIPLAGNLVDPALDCWPYNGSLAWCSHLFICHPRNVWCTQTITLPHVSHAQQLFLLSCNKYGLHTLIFQLECFMPVTDPLQYTELIIIPTYMIEWWEARIPLNIIKSMSVAILCVWPPRCLSYIHHQASHSMVSLVEQTVRYNMF